MLVLLSDLTWKASPPLPGITTHQQNLQCLSTEETSPKPPIITPDKHEVKLQIVMGRCLWQKGQK